MENSKRNKEIFFAHYLYQDVLFNGVEIVTLNKSWNWAHESFRLILKPLSSITDDDAIEVSRIEYGNNPDYVSISSGKTSTYNLSFAYSGGHSDYVTQYIGTADYLRSKGYAIPFMKISVEQLVEYGWIKLKTE